MKRILVSCRQIIFSLEIIAFQKRKTFSSEKILEGAITVFNILHDISAFDVFYVYFINSAKLADRKLVK